MFLIRTYAAGVLRRLTWRTFLITGDTCVLDRWLWVRKHLRPRARTFDAGSGNGAFSFGAAAIGCQVLSASFSDAEMSLARRRSEQLGLPVAFRVIDLRDLEAHRAQIGTFEQIVCLETIEHLSDDAGLLQTLGSMLQPGGQILVTSPYAEHRPQPGEDSIPDPTEDGGHVRFGYTPERLGALLAGAGLVVTEQTFVSGMISQYLTNLMRVMTRVMPARGAWVVVLPFRPLVLLDPLVSRRYPYLSVAARAVRPSE